MARLSSFIPSEELKNLTAGSYETLRQQIESAIEIERSSLFGSDVPVQVLGTFQGYAVVLSEDSKVFRVKYERSNAGDISPISAEILNVPVYSTENVAPYALKTARQYVDAFLAGAKTSALEHLKTLAPLTDAYRTARTVEPKKVLEAFENLLNGDRGWKRVYAEKTAQIHEAVKDATPLTESLRPKFHRLSDGSTSAAELPRYEGLVTADLKYLSERIESLLSSTEKSVTMYRGSVPALKNVETDPTVKMFNAFVEDYRADLRGVVCALSEATSKLTSVADRGQIHDTVVASLSRYEIAGRFVETMSRRLTADAEEGT